MNKNDKMNIGENLQWSTILLLAYLAYSKDLDFILIALFFSLNILLFGNARRVKLKNENSFITFLRRNIYILPLLLPLLIGFKPGFKTESILLWIIVGIFIGLIPIFYKFKEWQLGLSYDLIGMQKKFSKMHYITMIYITIGAAVTEEIFFRGFLIEYIRDTMGLFSVLFSAYMFMLHHLGCKWAQDSFMKFDYIVQFFIGLISALMYYFSKSIIPSIFLHLTYNFPHVLVYFRSYRYNYSEGIKETYGNKSNNVTGG